MARLQLRVKGKNSTLVQPSALRNCPLPRTVVDVFLSSTAMDLATYRAALHARLSRHDMFHCTRMEDFGAQSTSAVAFCREKASKADMLVGLIGMRRGWEPANDEQNRSITEIEQDAARD